MTDEFLTTEEVAQALRVHKATVTRWLKENRLTAMKVGRRWLIPKSDYEAFVANVSKDGIQ